MLIITSDPELKRLADEGRRVRSFAFWRIFSKVSFAARPKVVTTLEKGAACAQGCPS